MIFCFGKNFDDEVRRIIAEDSQDSDGRISTKELLEKIDELTATVSQLSAKVATLERNNASRGNGNSRQTTESIKRDTEQGHNTPQEKKQPVAPQPAAKQKTKIVYSGFESGGFPMRFKVGIGENGMNNPRGKWIVEYVNGESLGTFYPNPSQMDSLAFNVDYNMAPVCEVSNTGIKKVLSPGIVRYDNAAKTFVVQQKCKVSL